MPAAAVASFTPAMGESSGVEPGARGEMTVGIGTTGKDPCPFASRGPAPQDAATAICRAGRRFSVLFGLVGLGVEPFDLGALARLGDEVLVRLLHQHDLDAVLHRIEGGRLALALVLDLDDVPAEL